MHFEREEGSSSSGVGGHSSLEEGCVLISRRGSSSVWSRGSYFAGGGVHFDLEEGIILSLDKGYCYLHWRRGIFEAELYSSCR